MGPIWQAQLGESLVMLIGPSWEPNLLPYWAPNLGPIRQCSNCPKGGGGSKFFFRWELRDEVGGRNLSLGGGLRDEVGSQTFFRHGVEKEVGVEFYHQL